MMIQPIEVYTDMLTGRCVACALKKKKILHYAVMSHPFINIFKGFAINYEPDYSYYPHWH